MLLQHNFINTPGILVRMSATRQILPFYTPAWWWLVDWHLWILLAATDGAFHWNPEPLHCYTVHAESNSNNFDTRVPQRGGYIVELETRYSLFSLPGKLRTIGWLNSAYSGSYRETLNNPALNLDISQTRTGRTKYGYAINLEQAITDDIGLFGRWSWNDGKTEIMAFTDIDASLAMGASIKGTKWGRPDDVIGIGGAINALSRDHRDFIAAGGLGPLIGDGQLNYRKERVLETYYAYALTKQLTLTADYQFLTNPAYNADRGPVHVFSGRFHGEF
jgi:high affinity Mn2+ porin